MDAAEVVGKALFATYGRLALRTISAQALVQFGSDCLAIKVLADEDYFLHAVAIFVVPVLAQVGISFHKGFKLLPRHGGIPLANVTQVYLAASLFEKVASVPFIAEIADSLGADHSLGPAACYKLIEHTQVHGLAPIVDVGANAVLFHFAAFVVMMMVVMVMPMVVFMFVVIIVVIMMVVMMFFFLLMVVVMVFMIFFIFLLVVVMVFMIFLVQVMIVLYLVDPCG